MNVIAWGAPQWTIVGYFFLFTIFPLIMRALMMTAGARGFVPWTEYLRERAAWVGHSVVVGVVLYFGGFWN